MKDLEGKYCSVNDVNGSCILVLNFAYWGVKCNTLCKGIKDIGVTYHI